MDFSRVKLLLIAVFLGLNIFLVTQWLTLQSSVSVYAEPLSDQLAHAQSVLSVRGVQLAVPVPAGPTQMSALLITYDHSSLAAIGAALLGVKPAQASKMQHGASLLIGSGMRVSRLGLGTFRVDFEPVISLGHTASGHPKVNALKYWITKHDYNGQNYVYLGAQGAAGQTREQFVQIVNGLPDFSSRIVADVRGSALQSFEQNGVTVLATEPPRPLMNAVSALLSLADFLDKANLQVDNTSIEDIKLGYAAPVTSTQEWLLTPVWRMQTTRGTFLVNAFSGEVGVESS